MTMGANFLGRGRGPATVEMAAPGTDLTRAAQQSAGGQNGLRNQVVSEGSALLSGRVSLLALNSMILLMVLFYLWTRSAQGGR